MLKKLISYLVLAVCCALEVFLVIPGGYDIFHGGAIHTFIGMLGLIGFPVIGIVAIWHAFFKKKKTTENKTQNTEKEIEIKNNLSKKRKANYISMLDELPNKRAFRDDIDSSKDQITRFESYLCNIHNICLRLVYKDKINVTECENAIKGAIGIFYSRIESMLACIRLFDANEYRDFCSGELEFKSQKSIIEKKALFEKTFNNVKGIINSNEELILAVHKLLLALNEMNLSKEWDTETILATRKLNDYIKSTEGGIELSSMAGQEVLEYLGKNGPTIKPIRK